MKERAQEYLDAGKPEEAITTMNAYLRDSPRDVQAQGILKNAQNKWLESKLIQVRLLRLGGNLGESEKLLKSVINRQNEWGLYPTGVVFATQNEEIDLLAKRIHEQFSQAIKEGRPLFAQWLLDQNRGLLSDTLKTNINSLELSAKNQGKKFCLEQVKSVSSTDFYSYRFLKSTCDLWAVKIPEKKTKNSVALYRKANFEIAVKNLREDLRGKLLPVLEKTFAQSFWYDREGLQELNIDVNGFFLSSLESVDVRLSKTYYVQVPYQEKYKRSNRQPAQSQSAFGAAFQVISILSSNDRTKDNGDGTETVTVTKYRSESREHSYLAKKFLQALNVDWTIKTALNGQKMNLEFQDAYAKESTEHNERFYEAGLAPESRQVLPEEEYIQLVGEKLVQAFGRNLSKAWYEQFCDDEDFKNKKMAQTLSRGEQIQRCLHGTGIDVPGFADTWMLEKFGVTYDQWKSLSQEKTNDKI